MQLISAIVTTLLKSALIIGALVAVLFAGTLLITEAGPSLREGLETPQRLDELQEEGHEYTEMLARQQGESTAHDARRRALEIRLHQEQQRWEQQLEEELVAIEEAAEQQIDDVQTGLEDHIEGATGAADELVARYCESWNPVDWLACRAVRRSVEATDERIEDQRRAVEDAVDHLREQARKEAEAHRQAAREHLQDQTAEFEKQLGDSLDAMDELAAENQQVQQQLDEIRMEASTLRDENWLWIEFRDRWPYLLVVALLIFAAPYLRRTLWYFVGMPLVSRAEPIELHSLSGEGEDTPDTDDKPLIECGKSKRTLQVEVPPGEQLVSRIGYVQSEREGAKSELFFDRQAPNLSYISGLVLLTRLQSVQADDSTRTVTLGTPDDPDTYLMTIDLKDHPGVVLRARHVVGVIGDITIDSTWRLTNLHAWATSQVRFIVFSGTGTLIVEGYGDVMGQSVDGGRQQKRMPLVIGFDTRLTYQTQRSATFLPYLVDPKREPLVVDVFEGEGMVFAEKNPSVRKHRRSAGEAVAGFFLDVFRKLLGL